jgi:hypothetical protein
MCKRPTEHLVLQSIDVDGSENVSRPQDELQTIDWSDNYQVIQCQGCKTISFRHVNWFSEYVDEYWDGKSVFLYPNRSENTLPLKEFYNLPTKLRRIYRETIDCFNNDCNTMCAVALRAIIEGICADRNVKDGPVKIIKNGSEVVVRKRDLVGKIAGLFEKGILTNTNAEILHEHRYLGNDAVHKLSLPSTEELRLAIEIIEHVIESLYEIPVKAKKLQDFKLKRN